MRIHTRRNKIDIAIEQVTVDQPEYLDSIPEHPEVCDECPLVPEESNFNSHSTLPSPNNDLDIPIALKKVLEPIINIPSLTSFSIILCLHPIKPFYCLFTLFLSHRIGRKYVLIQNGRQPWWRR